MASQEVIVAAVDGTPASDAGVVWAAREAESRHAVLRIVHVWHSPSYPTDPVLAIPERQDVFVNSAAVIAVETAPFIDIEVLTQAGIPSITLLQMTEGASLIVLGGHRRNRLDRIVFGSVTTHLLARASCPVLVVRSERAADASEVGPVVVGLDHDDTSDDALDFAFAFAASHGRDLVALQAWTAHELSASDQDVPTTIRGVQDALSAGMRLFHMKYPSVDVVTVAACESPVDALLDWSDKASLLVVGSRGRGYFAGMLLGSVSSAVAHQAACSVAVVRPRTMQQLLDALAS
ncbi:MAG: universal stress protein [bacterium]|nr:universal stress protein [bacterium]